MSGSLGAARVRETFNPTGDEMVRKFKVLTADLIDLCEDYKRTARDAQEGTTFAEQARCAALAQTHYEIAAMFAVKAATTGK